MTFDDSYIGIVHIKTDIRPERDYPCMQLTVYNKNGIKTDSMVFFAEAVAGPGGQTTETVKINTDKTFTIVDRYLRMVYDSANPGGKLDGPTKESLVRVNAQGKLGEIEA